MLPLVVIDFITLTVISHFPWKDRGAAPNRCATPWALSRRPSKDWASS
jgi:hypothetical protein